jgi:type II secretory pathway pseudopilin PulG
VRRSVSSRFEVLHVKANTKKGISRTRRGGAGFTLVEIIAALAVFMIGVMGMVALQGVSIQAATKSRQQTAAVGISRYMITQLKNEFAAWQMSQPLPGGNLYPLLSGVFTNSANNSGSWVQFGGAVASGGDLRLDEFLGHSGLDDGSASRFCVNYWVSPLEVNLPEGTTAQDFTVWLVRVRVSWTKDGYFLTDNIDWDVCDADSVADRIATGSDDVVELVSTATREFAR